MISIPATAAVVPSVEAGDGAAAVVSPYDGVPSLQAFAWHGWQMMALLPEPLQRPLAYQAAAASADCISTVVHRVPRKTVKSLRATGASAVTAGSAADIEPAERTALGLPGADPASSPLRYGRGVQADLLARSGTPALRDVCTTSLADAMAWARACPLPGYLIGLATADSPIEPLACTSDLQIRAAWPATRREAAEYSGSAHLILTERHSLRQYRLHHASLPGPDERPEHANADIWQETHTSTGQLDRTDLITRDRLFTRTLSLPTRRALDALGVVGGTATIRVAYDVGDSAGDGPLVLSAPAAPVVAPADPVLRTATGHDRIVDVLDAWLPSPAALVPAPGRQRIARVPLEPHWPAPTRPSATALVCVSAPHWSAHTALRFRGVAARLSALSRRGPRTRTADRPQGNARRQRFADIPVTLNRRAAPVTGPNLDQIGGCEPGSFMPRPFLGRQSTPSGYLTLPA